MGLQELGEVEDAHNSFSTAIMLCTALPDGWLSWGAFCDARARAQGGTAWLDHTVTAYLQVSIHITSHLAALESPMLTTCMDCIGCMLLLACLICLLYTQWVEASCKPR